MTVSIHHGDSRDVLKTLADASIDSCVTDPPYALVSIGKRFGADGAAPAKSGKSGAYARASAGFMGQKWDTGKTAFDPDFWREVYRVLKPGAHVVAFGGTRTYHRLACAIEDAGFEIRDQIAWLYGSGFPKSHDVSKGIQKSRREDVAPIRIICRAIRAAMDAKGLKSRDLAPLFDGCHPRLVDHWAARDTDSQPALPTPAQWAGLKSALDIGDSLDGEFGRLSERKGMASDDWTGADIVGQHEGATPGLSGMRFSAVDATIRTASDEASEWAGWGTALKPALEPIVLARKPLIGTVAANVQAHGCGALNIGASRIDSGDKTAAEYTVRRRKPGAEMARTGGDGYRAEDAETFVGQMRDGRWPANVIHDGSPEVIEAFPDAPGALMAVGPDQRAHRTVNAYGAFDNSRHGQEPRGDTGSAARFFYTAKADAEDRLGSRHPTVKPVDLMAYLCRLVTPPGGTVLDPFAGSGTTGQAAMTHGFSAVLIELDDKFHADIQRRIAWASGEGRLTALETAKAADLEKADGSDMPLFQGAA